MAKPEFVLLISTLILVSFCVVLVFASDYLECKNTASIMDVNFRYGITYGCMIEIQSGTWIPLDSYYWKEDADND